MGAAQLAPYGVVSLANTNRVTSRGKADGPGPAVERREKAAAKARRKSE